MKKLRSFRLLAFDPNERAAMEWKWNVQQLRRLKHEWKIGHWFSSGFDERTAEAVRAKICASIDAGGAVVAGGVDPGWPRTWPRAQPAGVSAPGYNNARGDNGAHASRQLRALHRSHAPMRGPFSICMHRADAATVSYAEVCSRRQRATMRYARRPALQTRKITTKTIARL